MRILFASFSPHIPYVIAGGPMDLHHLAQTFSTGEDHSAVLASLPGLPESVRWRQLPYRFRQAVARKHLLVFSDSTHGYQTYRVGYWLISQLLEERIHAWRPDVVVVQGVRAWELAQVAVRLHVPVVLRQIDTYGPQAFAQAMAGSSAIESLLANPLFTIVSNSRFVASRVQDLLGFKASVVHPLIRPEDCVSERRCPEYVTFVSPVPQKGLSTALAVAGLLPHRRFLFVDGWSTRPAQRKSLEQELTRLPNVTMQRASIGLKEALRSTAVLLMPSQVEEAFGRVVVEGGLNAIPAVASDTGGLPESIGKSGILLDPAAHPRDWADAIESMLSEQRAYARLSAGALANAQREEFRVATVAARFRCVLEELLLGNREVSGERGNTQLKT